MIQTRNFIFLFMAPVPCPVTFSTWNFSDHFAIFLNQGELELCPIIRDYIFLLCDDHMKKSSSHNRPLEESHRRHIVAWFWAELAFGVEQLGLGSWGRAIRTAQDQRKLVARVNVCSDTKLWIFYHG